ncbi:Uncharacterised protein [Vibrio cholerae]|nr:Uncharacterised protein [Vibrio cholerae]
MSLCLNLRMKNQQIAVSLSENFKPRFLNITNK